MGSLPNELFVEIFKYLDPNEIRVARSTNDHWNELVSFHNLLRPWAVSVVEKLRHAKLKRRKEVLDKVVRNWWLLKTMEAMSHLRFST